MSTGSFDWLPGRKEGKDRADALMKRRASVSAMTTDLIDELDDLKITLELEKDNFPPADLLPMRRQVDKASQVMDAIYQELNVIGNLPIPERINEIEAQNLIQPTLRLERLVQDVRPWLDKAKAERDKLDRPRKQVDGMLEQADRRRLQVETELEACKTMVAQLKAGKAENFPEVEAACLTAGREISAGSALLMGARQAIARKGYKEALDTATRSLALFDSGASKFVFIRQRSQEAEKYAEQADDRLAVALQKLQAAKQELEERASVIHSDPNTYLQAAIQRIGEARRAVKANPPQAMTAFRLANEAITLIDDLMGRVHTEIKELRDKRLNARDLNLKLSETVSAARMILNENRAVPVRAREQYEAARREQAKLEQMNIDSMKPTELDLFARAATNAVRQAEEAIKLVEKLR